MLFLIIMEEESQDTEATKVMKPWGYLEKLASGGNYYVQKIHIKAGERTSLHAHKKRSELWQCIKGNPKVLLVEHPDRLASAPLVSLKVGESSQVKKECLHRIDNRNATCEAELIEIQFGDCQEEDIIRYQDDYSRLTVDFPKPSLTIAKDSKNAEHFLAMPGKKIFKFTASWCGPCKTINPEYRKIAAARHGSVSFYEVDVDVCDEFTEKNSVQAMPTFVAFKDSEEIARFSGASPKNIEELVDKLHKS